VRSYDEPIEVRRGLVAGQEAPAQFVWRERFWVVREVVSHWVETGAWWEHPDVTALVGSAAGGTGRHGGAAGATGASDLLGERENWRVEARCGRATSAGVFDLSYDTAEGQWRLVCVFD
jgi:hypothetical protein